MLSAAGYSGGSHILGRKLEEFRDELLRDVEAAGFVVDEAINIVDRNLVGKKRAATGPATLYASPEAIALFLMEQAEKTPPLASEGWSSTNQLRGEYLFGTKDIEGKIEEYRRNLILNVVAAGHPVEEATGLIDQNLIGRKKPIKGRASMHVSPDAIEMLERDGELRRKVRPVLRADLIVCVREMLIQGMRDAGIPAGEVDAILVRAIVDRPKTGHSSAR